MSETKISAETKAAIKKEYPEIQFTRLQCGSVRVRGGFMRLSDPGWPDYIGYLPNGRFLGIEVKDPKGHTQKERAVLQTARKAHINMVGGFSITVTSAKEAIELLRPIMEELRERLIPY